MPLLPRQVGAPADLPQPGDAGLDQQPPGDVAVVAFDLLRQRRARTHQAHLAGQHVDQLRQLVQGPLAQPPTDPGHPWIVTDLEQQTVVLVPVGQQVTHLCEPRPAWCGTSAR